jgi:hypothetical protein
MGQILSNTFKSVGFFSSSRVKPNFLRSIQAKPRTYQSAMFREWELPPSKRRPRSKGEVSCPTRTASTLTSMLCMFCRPFGRGRYPGFRRPRDLAAFYWTRTGASCSRTGYPSRSAGGHSMFLSCRSKLAAGWSPRTIPEPRMAKHDRRGECLPVPDYSALIKKDPHD